MGKITKSIPHLSKEEIQERIKATGGILASAKVASVVSHK